MVNVFGQKQFSHGNRDGLEGISFCMNDNSSQHQILENLNE